MTDTKVLAPEASNGISERSSPVVLRLTLIGQMEAWTPDESSVLPLGRKTRALLAILALSAPRPVVRARLAELLWSRRHEEQARASLRQEIHRLLDALQPSANEILTVTRDHVSLRPDHVWIDVEEVLRATPSNPLGLELLKGKLLDEFDGIDPAFDVWLAAEREHLQDRARAVGEGLLRQQVDPEAMIPIAQRLLGIDRAHEGAWRALMGAYAARGDRGMAVQAYERCRAVLREKLDAVPSPETQRLLAGIRAGGNGAALRGEPVPSEVPAMSRSGVRIGILPLQMLGTDPDEAHLSLSLADDITAALSVFRPISPISSSSLQQHGSRDEGVLRRAFGLDYLVDGSVQRAGSRLRITIRLLDLDDGNRVAWAHRFDHDGSDLLSLQDDVTAEVSGQIYPEIMAIESRRATARPLAAATAYDLIMRAIPLMARLRRDDFEEAGNLIRRALVAEPDLAAAHACRADWLGLLASQGWSQDLEATRQEAGEHAERAVTLDPGDAACLAVAGHVRAFLHHQPREALELHERALAANPNLSMAVGLAAVTLTYLGDAEAAARYFTRHTRVSPIGPVSFYFDAGLALLEILRRDVACAIRFGRRATELNPNYTAGLKHYLAALGHAGLQAEARVVQRRLLVAEPGFTIQHVLAMPPFNRPADVAYYTNGLRLAGLPEGRAAVA
jgi:DNA-binding SARP family transcriptional activator/Tfp pilus assembly protein PilF